LAPVNNPTNYYILSGIAFFVLLIACINFMNLSIARSSSRMKEIGVRQVTGAQRLQLMKQFWGEAFLMSHFALLLGVVLAELFLPTFGTLANKKLSLNYYESSITLLTLLGVTALTGLIAGSYPRSCSPALNRWKFCKKTEDGRLQYFNQSAHRHAICAVRLFDCRHDDYAQPGAVFQDERFGL
jgi:hypothetical protein